MHTTVVTGVLLLMLVSPSHSSCGAQSAIDEFVGAWKYRQENSAADTGYDSEGERLLLKRDADSLTGIYLGLEREGEHGLFYSAVKIEDVIVSEDGRLSFTVPRRRLFSQRPNSLEEAARMEEADNVSGNTNVTLQMAGRFDRGVLVLKCEAVDGYSCPAESLSFHKGKWPLR